MTTATVATTRAGHIISESFFLVVVRIFAGKEEEAEKEEEGKREREACRQQTYDMLHSFQSFLSLVSVFVFRHS